MMRNIIEHMGVDYRQWRALILTSLKQDLRVAYLGQARARQRQESNATRAWFFRLLIYVVMGAFVSPLIWINKDVFLTGTLYLAYIMVMVAMLVLIDFAAVVISPDDFAILGYQPISSRTFFVARITNVLVYTTGMAMALGLIPIGMYFFAHGWNLSLGLAALVATLLTSAAVALTLVLLYAWFLRYVHPAKLRRVMSYLQFIMSFLIYGGYIFIPRLVDSKLLAGARLDDDLWVYLIPSSWFAGYLRLAAGEGGWGDVLRVVGSLAGISGLIFFTRGKLSLDYAAALSNASAVSEGKAAAETSPVKRSSWFFKTGEARAVALLIRNQFRYDQKFKLAVLGILPITFLYLILGLQHGTPKDPFVEAEAGFANIWMIYLAITLLPVSLRQSLIHSDAYLSSWIYFATPADQGRLVLATKDFVYAYFVLPYLILVGAILLYFFHNPIHVLLHLLLLALLTHLMLQLTTLLSPDLPFSQPVRKGQRSTSLLVLMMLCQFLGIGMIYAFSRWVYPRPMLHFGAMASLAGITWLLEKAIHARIARQWRQLRYADG